MTEAVLQHAVTNWNAAAVLVFDGERAAPPAAEPWIRLTIRDLPTRTVTHGARGNRQAERRATLIAQVFYPTAISDGAGPALAIAQDFRDLFEPADVTASTGVVHIVGGASLRRIGNTPDAAWYQVNVDVPLTYHETI